jgi:hypothetical protein
MLSTPTHGYQSLGPLYRSSGPQWDPQNWAFPGYDFGDVQSTASPITSTPASASAISPYAEHLQRGHEAKASLINIGTIDSTSDLETIVFKYSAPGCDGKTFNRWHELKRHYNGV